MIAAKGLLVPAIAILPMVLASKALKKREENIDDLSPSF